MEGLNPNTTYYIRAYATNEGGTAYGNQISVTLWLNQTGPQLTDYDGNTYNSVKIGNQIWMRTNLKTTHYRDGSPIPLVTGNSAWAALSSGAYCNYNNDVATVGTYGRLYNFYAVADSRNICPSGWHVPSDVEWTTLFDYLGGQNTVADKLRETGTTHWTSPNPGATNISGFTALPAGERSYIDGTFGQLGTLAEFWSSTSFSSSEAWDVYLYYTFDNAVIRSMYKGGGFSIRCVKD
jgi:uncharacterized protein (TIGR02145 family)